VPVDFEEMFAPAHTAVLTMEVQRGVVGDLSALPALSQAAEDVGLFASIRELLRAARSAGVPVVHCTAGPDKVPDAPPNYPGAAAMAKRRAAGGGGEGPGFAELVVDIGPEPTDLVVERHHGITPFTGTELDAVLRRLGTRTVVACGVSLNVGIIGLSVEAVSLGYRVAVALDAVVGVPVEYGKAVIEHTLPFVATRLSVADLRSVWSKSGT